MTGRFDDPERIERAKQQAAGDLGQQIVRFPLQFAEPVIIGSVPEAGRETQLNNGSATLLRIWDRDYAITCAHVVNAFRAKRDEAVRPYVFQVGMLELDPEKRLVGLDTVLDIAVLDITGLNHSRASTFDGGAFQFHEPRSWPPEPPGETEFVSFAGYPGVWRQPPVGDRIEFDTFAVGAHPVTSAHRDRLAFQFEREYWISSFGGRGKDLKSLGGMSGGPVMVMRRLHWDLAGIVTHFSEDWDILFAAPAVRIRGDGSIESA